MRLEPTTAPAPPRMPAGDAGAPHPDDAALVRRARAGSREAGAQLFRRHWPAAWRAALAITGRPAAADDVAQGAFERAFGALDAFDPSRPFRPWLHRIVVNRALDLLRAERRLVSLPGEAESRPAPEAAGTLDGAVREALLKLSPERRAVVVLRHLLDLSPPEIAEALDLPVGTVHSRLGRAMAQLRAELEAPG